MSITEKIAKKIARINEGTTFKYQQLKINRDEYTAAAKAIERLIRKGIIKRVSTGIFYKPLKTVFGDLKPSEEETLKSYLFINGKRIAYITGILLYNRMGLTTQVPNTIKLASKEKRVITKIGKIKVRPVKSYVDVTNKNYHLLELLDALKDFKIIPDLDRRSAIILLRNRIEKLSENELSRLVKYSIKYPPRARALLGALLTELRKDKLCEPLKSSLNPLTKYELGINQEVLPSAPNWNIY